MQRTFVPLNIASYWDAVQNDLLAIVDLIPNGQMDYSPKPTLWNFRGLLLHITASREGWLGGIGDGAENIDVWRTVRSNDEIKSALERTYRRLQAFLSNAAQLDARYDTNESGETSDGHWVAFHMLEHDIHHRADMLHYLAMLDVDCSSMSFQ